MSELLIAVVIPCFRVKTQVLSVIASIGPEIWRIYVVDDCCPEHSGEYVAQNHSDDRVVVLKNSTNLGVGGATARGYQEALKDGADVIVKMDGDGQMSGSDLPNLVRPLVQGKADYAKGNRFYDLKYLRPMPIVRLFGNSALSFVTKLSCGYWNIMDPTNGFTAVHREVLSLMDLESLERRYFFESDMLYQMYLLRAVVWDVPMTARYANEVSGLKVVFAIFEFSFKHFVRIARRIFYTYYLRDFQIGSVFLMMGVLLSTFGVSFGAYNWHRGVSLGILNPNGTIMLAALPCLMGLQLLLTFVSADINNVPSRPIHSLLPREKAGDLG